MEDLRSIHGLALFAAAIAGLAIAHRAVLHLPIGLPRLVFILPILPIFFMLPWTISNYHLRAILSFIFLWTVPSKLLLLCWDAGIDYPSSGFLYFATIVMLPIRVRGKKEKKHSQGGTRKSQFWWQFIAVIIILNIYSYRKGLPIWAIYVLYACHIYLGLELMLGGLAKLATTCFGVESDPQFNNPFMSASLSEFWGRRWNLIVTTILRSTVYNPALLLLMRVEKQKAHQSKVPETNNGPGDSRVQTMSPCSQEQEANLIASVYHQGTHSDNLISINMDKSHAADSENSNLSLVKQGLSQTGSQNDDHASLGNVIDTHATDASKDDHLNHSTHLEPGLNPKPSQNLHPISSFESSRHEVEDGIKHNGAVTEMKTCSHNSHLSDTADDAEGKSISNPKPCVICDTCSPNPTITQQTDENLNSSKDDTVKSSADLDRNPTSYLDTAARDAEKPILRARVATMLRARAATMLSYPGFYPKPNPHPEPISPKPSPSQELYPAMWKKGADQKGVMGSREKPSLWAKAVAMLVTFAVSGLVHELIFYYINKSRATGEVTAFFMLHGCATALEVLLKKTILAQVHLPRPLSIALTLAFLYYTAAWLFMPPLTRNNADINTIAEYQRLQSALLSLFTNRHWNT